MRDTEYQQGPHLRYKQGPLRYPPFPPATLVQNDPPGGRNGEAVDVGLMYMGRFKEDAQSE